MPSDHTEYMRKYRKTPTGRAANRRNAAKSRMRRKVELLQGRTSCCRCGVSDLRVLQFHHPDPSRKEHVLGKYAPTTVERLAEAAECEVLCANCHIIEHCTWDIP